MDSQRGKHHESLAANSEEKLGSSRSLALDRTGRRAPAQAPSAAETAPAGERGFGKIAPSQPSARLAHDFGRLSPPASTPIQASLYAVGSGPYSTVQSAIEAIRSIAIVLGADTSPLYDPQKVTMLGEMHRSDLTFEVMSVAATLDKLPPATGRARTDEQNLKRYCKTYFKDFKERDKDRIKAPVEEVEEDKVYLAKNYRVAYGCVLQALTRCPDTDTPKDSAKEMHDYIWADESPLAKYKQYDDDGVYPGLYALYDLSKTEGNGRELSEVASGLDDGNYILSVNTAGVDGHMVSMKVEDGAYKDSQDPGNRMKLKDDDTVMEIWST